MEDNLMAWYDRFRLKNVFAIGEDVKQAPVVQYYGIGSSAPSKDKYEDLADEGYVKNAIAYRCVNEIAQGASSVAFKVFSGETELEEHPIKSLLNRPSPLMSGAEYFNSLYSYMLLSGNAYLLRSGPESQPPKELHLLRPDRMKIVAGARSIPMRYEYVVNGRVIEKYEVDNETGLSDVKHMKMWHPLDDHYGMSPMKAASVDVDQYNLSGKHNVNLLFNGARPSGAVVFKPQDDSGMPTYLSESQRQQLLTDLKNRFSGTSNTGRPLLLEGDFDWKEMGMSPRDMDFLNLRHLAAKDIALCFGVPSQLIGVPDAQTYSNMAEARLALYEETIIPLMQRVQEDINEWLVPQFEENIRVVYDIDSIPALTERRKMIYENVIAAVRDGIITRNEARERLDMEPIEGGDDILVNASLFPLGATIPDAPVEEEDDEKTYEEEKAISDIDFKPTSSMATEAKRGLEWRKKFGRGGTNVGSTRASQLVKRENLTPKTVKRMFSFFSRHEVDKQAEGFSQGEKGYPSNGRIAWALWGGDAGFSWSKKKVKQIENESKALTGKTRKAIKNKVDDHNDKYGDNKTKRVTMGMLEKVYNRGVGAYRTNPQSVRPNVSSPEQWAMARVNSFLRALGSGKFKGGKHDTDLFPEGHPLRSKDKKEEVRDDVFSTPQEAEERAKEIGCVGIHMHDEDGQTIYMPCKTHEEYEALTSDKVKQIENGSKLHETAISILTNSNGSKAN
jgi:HK97 family phage portal protein